MHKLRVLMALFPPRGAARDERWFLRFSLGFLRFSPPIASLSAPPPRPLLDPGTYALDPSPLTHVERATLGSRCERKPQQGIAQYS